ncbi:MAG: EMC3/TMCO1 family protein [Candidatus Pacearchaeota archaeon]
MTEEEKKKEAEEQEEQNKESSKSEENYEENSKEETDSKSDKSEEEKTKKDKEEDERKQREEDRRKGKREHLIEESKGSFRPIFIIMLISLAIAGLWNEIPQIKESVNYVLDPTAGALLAWNLNWGMLVIAFFISLITTLAQKYGTDQETLKDLKKEQQDLQKEMKENKKDQKKMQELQKRQMKLMPNQMKLSMRAVAFTGVPFILLIRWFEDYFSSLASYDLWLGLSWFWFYLISLIVIGAILRKQMDVV